MSTRILHFTFGPVQDFVGQARRTRDLWAGSYLISYLAGCAMRAVTDHRTHAGGRLARIVLPSVDQDALFLALTNESKVPSSPDFLAASVGSLPNRFKAQVPDDFNPRCCKEAVQGKWEAIAGTVKAIWEAHAKDRADGGAGVRFSDGVWKRQIPAAWEFTWAFGDDGGLLDIRKNLRTHTFPPEYGEKCTVCGERQEISGKGMGESSRNDMRNWWNEAREWLRQIPKATLFDLRAGERLCAVCLVKRAFPLPEVAKQVIHWEVRVNYPSTAYMAAADWLVRVFTECAGTNGGVLDLREKVTAFVKAANASGVWYSEKTAQLAEVINAGRASGLDNKIWITTDSENLAEEPVWKVLASMDGDAFFQSAIKNEKDFEVEGKDNREKTQKREALLGALKTLQRALPEQSGQPREATPFYALLLMDGDGMGALLSGYSSQQENIAEALAEFTRAVPDIVKECNGRLVYAGGDDVLALLPLDRAIHCARRCRAVYQDAFTKHTFGIPHHKATISAAIEYAHRQTALGVVVKDAHLLLDEVAKEGCGRDGLACRVWKRGGPIVTWAQPWEEVLKTETTVPEGRPQLETIVDEVKYLFQDEYKDRGKFSSKFFYKLRDLFDLLAPDGLLGLAEEAARKLMAAEYLANRDAPWPKDLSAEKRRGLAETRVARLLALCQGKKRKVDGTIERGGFNADGALFIRFLAQKQV